MSYPVRHIVNTFLRKDFEDNQASITPLKMQKLVFFLNGWYLAIMNEPVIENEFRAWKYGPVEEQLYHLLKEYKGNPITAYLPDEDGKCRAIASDEKDFQPIFNAVWQKYSPFTAVQLSALTHEKGTPWDMVYKSYTIATIPNALTKSFFKQKINHE